MVQFSVAILALTPPVAGLTVILLVVGFPPRIRSTLGFGLTALLAAGTLAMLGAGSAVLDGQQPFWPYLVFPAVPAIAVARMMQIQLRLPD